MLPKTLPLFGKILPVQSIIESYQKTAGSRVDIDGLNLLVCVYDPFGGGLFGPDSIRVRAISTTHKVEMDINASELSKYPIGYIEKSIVKLFKTPTHE